MRQVSPAVACASLAGTFWVEWPEVPSVPRVLEVETASCGQGSTVAREAGREHAVKHVNPKRYDLENADGVAYPHEVPWLLGWQHRRRDGQCLEHLLPRLANREPPTA